MPQGMRPCDTMEAKIIKCQLAEFSLSSSLMNANENSLKD